MDVTGNSVQVQWFNGFAVVRLEVVELVKDGNLSDVSESCGAGFAHVDLTKFCLRFAYCVADGFGSVGVEDVNVLIGVVGEVALEPVAQGGHCLAHVVVSCLVVHDNDPIDS